jgi:hypothetical protein
LWVVVCVTETYAMQAANLLDSLFTILKTHSLAPRARPPRIAVVAVHFYPTSLKPHFPGVHWFSVHKTRPLAVDPEFPCLAYGDFLTASLLQRIGYGTLLLVDADARFQRWLTPEEEQRFLAYSSTTCGVGYNDGPQDTLALEAARLVPNVPPELLEDRYPHAGQPVFNTGVLIGKAPFFVALRRHYQQHWPLFRGLFSHRSKNQWLLSWLLHQHFQVDVLGYEIHSHGHYPLTSCHSLGSQGQLLYHGEPVLVRHHV